jgi:hypothetical protein
MKVLVFGPSGSGKTYVSTALRGMGVNAFDADDIKGLWAWYDKNGKKVAAPATADEAISRQYAFLWSKKALTAFLDQFPDVYVFGGSGNIAHVFDLFDKIYFLKVEPGLQKERLLHASRSNPAMDKNEDGIVIWGDWFEELAAAKNIPFIDASLAPEAIFTLIAQ